MRSTGTGNWRAPHGRNAAGFVVAEVASLVNASVVGLEKISVNLFFFFLAKILAKRRRTNFQSVFIWDLFFFFFLTILVDGEIGLRRIRPMSIGLRRWCMSVGLRGLR